MDNDLDELTNLLDSDTFNEEVKATSQPLSDKPVKTSQPQKKSLAEVFDNQQNKSEIHNGDTDSSDDEDNKYASEQKYTDTGRTIKNSLKKSIDTTTFYSQKSTWKQKNTSNSIQQTLPSKSETLSKDIYSDPFFGIRIITPLISSQAVKEKMAGKIPVTLNKLEKHLQIQDNATDWVVAGVIVSKYTKTSQKGNPFTCWTLSDLREGLKTISVFLFGKAYKDLWKTSTHVVVAILNPNPLDSRKGSSDIAALSVLNADQVMIWGQSKDLGICRARKKNGEPCTSFVNKHQCEYCVYHVKQEYNKFNRRSELQASSGGSLTGLRNKVLGKNEVFYAGRSFTAVVAKPTTKQVKKDKTRLSQLFNTCESRLGFETNGGSKTPSQRIQSNRVLLLKDAQRLQSLTGSPATLKSLAVGPDKHDVSKVSSEPKTSKRISRVSDIKLEETKEKSLILKSSPVSANLKSKLENAVKKPQSTITPHQELVSNTENKSLSEKSSPLTKVKNKPTKNRFESLTKLKSTVNNSENLCHTNRSVLTKPAPNPKSEDLFAVSFDFDENEDNLLSFALDEVESNLKEKCSVAKSLNERNDISKPNTKITPKLGLKQNSLSSKTLNSFIKNSPPEPLLERRSPTKHESSMNISCKKEPQDMPTSAVKQMFSDIEKQFTEKKSQDLAHTKSPTMSQFGCLSLTVPVRQSRAKENALKYIKRNGPINKEDPTKPKSKGISSIDKKRKMIENEDITKDENKVLSKRFLDLMNTTSKHLDLISSAENEAIDEYYDKMEKKEKMEEKMLNTFKIDCKAFKCLKCKYKWFSPSELCKAENHPIKVISAVKRFFQCQNCKNRTVSLEVIPLHNCSNCGGANWQRAAMMRERKSTTVHLSIRGGEQKFTNSVVTDTNLDLLVPDDT